MGDQLVVFGGQASGELVDTVEVFDGQRWTETAALPTPREHLAGVSDGQFAYAVGGRNLSSDKNLGAFERFDPATGTWTKLPDLPTPRGGLGAVVTDGHLVTAGGESPTQVFDTVELFDLAAGAWSPGPPMLTARHGMAVDVLGSTIYAIDGAAPAEPHRLVGGGRGARLHRGRGSHDAIECGAGIRVAQAAQHAHRPPAGRDRRPRRDVLGLRRAGR